MTIQELTKNKFTMKVDSKAYDVYPDIRSITGTGRNNAEADKHAKELNKLENMQQSVAISRQIALKKYYEKLVYALKKEAGTKGKVTKT